MTPPADEGRLQRVIDRVAVVLPEGHVAVPDALDAVEGPEGRVARLRVGQAVLGEDLVEVGLSEQVEALAAHVGHLERHVANQLALDGDVPLPVVRVGRDLLQRVARRSERGGGVAGDDRVGVERSNDGGVPREGRVRADTQTRAHAVALVEAAQASADGHLAVAVDVPGDAHAGRDPQELGGHELTIRAVSSTGETEPGARVGSRRVLHPVAGRVAEGRVRRGEDEVPDRVVRHEGGLHVREPQAEIRRHAGSNLVGVGEVELQVPPPLLNLRVRLELARAERHAAEQDVGEEIAGVQARDEAIRADEAGRPIDEHRLLGRVVDLLVLVVAADESARLEEVLAEDRGEVVLQDVEVLVVHPWGLVPKVPIARTTPRGRLGDAASLLEGGGEQCRNQAVDLIDKRAIAGPRGRDLVGRVRVGQGVRHL